MYNTLPSFSEQDVTERVLHEFNSRPSHSVIYEYALNNSIEDIYIVGGAIRNIVLHRYKINDFDIFVDRSNFLRLLNKIVNYGEIKSGPLGSPRWFPYSCPENYCDIVPIQNINHGLGACDNITDALNQFDFTGNAIAINLLTMSVLDPFCGITDLRNNLMKAIRYDFPEKVMVRGNPITWRASRWFRILHYARELKLDFDRITLQWLIDNSHYYKHEKFFTNAFFQPNIGYFKDRVHKNMDNAKILMPNIVNFHNI